MRVQPFSLCHVRADTCLYDGLHVCWAKRLPGQHCLSVDLSFCVSTLQRLVAAICTSAVASTEHRLLQAALGGGLVGAGPHPGGAQPCDRAVAVQGALRQSGHLPWAHCQAVPPQHHRSTPHCSIISLQAPWLPLKQAASFMQCLAMHCRHLMHELF